MSQKRDPVVAVLQYFETADLALAKQALALAQLAVRRRLPAPVANTARPRRHRSKAKPGLPETPIADQTGGRSTAAMN